MAKIERYEIEECPNRNEHLHENGEEIPCMLCCDCPDCEHERRDEEAAS